LLFNKGVLNQTKRFTKPLLLSVGVFVFSMLGGMFLNTDQASAITKTQCEDRGGNWSDTINRARPRNCELNAANYSPADQLRSYSYFNAISQCSRVGDWDDDISASSVSDPGSWFNIYGVSVGYLVDKTDGRMTCNEMSKAALNLWGYTSTADYGDALVDFGYKLAKDGCVNARQSYDCYKGPTNILDIFQTAIKERIYNGASPSLEGNAGLLYYRAQVHLEMSSACGATAYKKVSELTAEEKTQYSTVNTSTPTRSGAAVGNDYLIVKIVDATNWSANDWVYKIPSQNWRKDIELNERPSGGSVKNSCYEIAESMAGYADRIVKDAANIIAANGNPATKYGLIVTIPGTSNQNINGVAIGDSIEDSTSCAINGVGWMICPAIVFLGDITDSMFQFLADSFLKIDIGILDTTGSNNGTFVAWGIMRNIANVAFVIAFLIIIFSQLTSLGVGNYGIKKLLPRLLISAILVNLSFYVCQIAVDLSNVLGYSVKGIFDGISGSILTETGTINQGVNGAQGFDGWGSIITLVLAGAGGVIAYGALGSLIAVLAASVVAILVIFFILMIRQMLVILLIVIAPLAFVAFLLPNTENLFNKWRKLFTTLLLLFPIIGVVFGASALASTILRAAYATSDNTIGQIVAAGVLIIPLIIVPGILKAALDGFGKLGSAINGLGNKAGGAAGKAGQNAFGNSRLASFQKYRKDEKDKRRALIQSGAYEGDTRNPLNRARNAVSKLNKGINAKTGRFGDRSAATGVSLAEKMEAEEVGNAETLIRSGTDPTELIGHASETLASAIKKGDVVKARAAQKILLSSGNKGVEALHETLKKEMPDVEGARGKGTAVGRNLRADLNAAGLKGKNNELASWAYNNASLKETMSDGATYSNLSDVELAGQSPKNLKAAADNGHISFEQAQTVVSNENVYKDLDPEKKALFADIIAKGKGSPTITSVDSVPTVSSKTSTPETIQIDHSGDQPAEVVVEPKQSFADNAVEKSYNLDQGSGTTPFVVDTGGTVVDGSAKTRMTTKIEVAAAGTPSEPGVVFAVGSNGDGATKQPDVVRVDSAQSPYSTTEAYTVQVEPTAGPVVAPNQYNSMDESLGAPINPAAIPSTSNIQNRSSGTPLDDSLYRVNSAGQPIRPSGTSGNDGAYISGGEKQAIDGRADQIKASQQARNDALAGGDSQSEADKKGTDAFNYFDK
jgi:hypothetical protein